RSFIGGFGFRLSIHDEVFFYVNAVYIKLLEEGTNWCKFVTCTSVFSSHKLQTCGSLVSSIARELIPSLLMAMNYISGPTHQPNNHKVAPHQRYGIKLKTKPHILLHLHT